MNNDWYVATVCATIKPPHYEAILHNEQTDETRYVSGSSIRDVLNDIDDSIRQIVTNALVEIDTKLFEREFEIGTNRVCL